MKNLKATAKKIITQYIDPLEPVSVGWPPACIALFYQPERPVMTKPDHQESIPQKD